MSTRYLVELENNHHYIVIDTVTGYSYFVPAQADANSLAGILNNNEDRLERQRHHIKELEDSLSKNGVIFEPNRTCRNCNNMIVPYITDNDEGYCELLEKGVSVNDYCNAWTLTE